MRPCLFKFVVVSGMVESEVLDRSNRDMTFGSPPSGRDVWSPSTWITVMFWLDWVCSRRSKILYLHGFNCFTTHCTDPNWLEPSLRIGHQKYSRILDTVPCLGDSTLDEDTKRRDNPRRKSGHTKVFLEAWNLCRIYPDKPSMYKDHLNNLMCLYVFNV